MHRKLDVNLTSWRQVPRLEFASDGTQTFSITSVCACPPFLGTNRCNKCMSMASTYLSGSFRTCTRSMLDALKSTLISYENNSLSATTRSINYLKTTGNEQINELRRRQSRSPVRESGGEGNIKIMLTLVHRCRQGSLSDKNFDSIVTIEDKQSG